MIKEIERAANFYLHPAKFAVRRSQGIYENVVYLNWMSAGLCPLHKRTHTSDNVVAYLNKPVTSILTIARLSSAMTPYSLPPQRTTSSSSAEYLLSFGCRRDLKDKSDPVGTLKCKDTTRGDRCEWLWIRGQQSASTKKEMQFPFHINSLMLARDWP